MVRDSFLCGHQEKRGSEMVFIKRGMPEKKNGKGKE